MRYVGPDMKIHVFNTKVNIFLNWWDQKAMTLQNKIESNAQTLRDCMQVDAAICEVFSDGVSQN